MLDIRVYTSLEAAFINDILSFVFNGEFKVFFLGYQE